MTDKHYSTYDPGNVIDLQSRRNGGGNPPGDGQLEARVAKLESDTSFIRTDMAEMKKDVRDLRSEARTDFRILFGALIAAALGLAGLMSRGFGWL